MDGIFVPDLQSESNILEYRHVTEQCVVLEDKPHAAIARGTVGDVLVVTTKRCPNRRIRDPR